MEEALFGKTVEERHEIEEVAIRHLKSKVPMYSWSTHQRDLAVRVLKRFELQLVNVTLLDLPDIIATPLSTYQPFKRGDKYKHKKYYKFAWGEAVDVSMGRRKRNTKAFVCRETDFYVFMINSNGEEFRKKKSNVKALTNRDQIVDALVREFEI